MASIPAANESSFEEGSASGDCGVVGVGTVGSGMVTLRSGGGTIGNRVEAAGAGGGAGVNATAGSGVGGST